MNDSYKRKLINRVLEGEGWPTNEDMRIEASIGEVIQEAYDRGRASGQQGVEGCKLVPVEPTQEMITATYFIEMPQPNSDGVFNRQECEELAANFYKTMLAASPQITSPAAQTSTNVNEETQFFAIDGPMGTYGPSKLLLSKKTVQALYDKSIAAQPSDSVQGWIPANVNQDDGSYIQEFPLPPVWLLLQEGNGEPFKRYWTGGMISPSTGTRIVAYWPTPVPPPLPEPPGGT